MRRRPPRSTLTGTLLTSTTLFRSASRLGRKSVYSDPVSACVFLARAKSAVLARGLKASTRDRILDAITFDHTCVSDRSGANGEGGAVALSQWYSPDGRASCRERVCQYG